MSLRSKLQSALPKTAFWRNLTLVAGGTAIGQAASILASPILTRLYGPKDFGVLAVYAALTGLGGVISSLAYQQAIPVPSDDRDAARVAVVATIGTVASGLLTFFVVLLTRSHIDSWLRTPGLSRYYWLVPLGATGLGAYEILSQWAARKKAFDVIGNTSAARSMVQVASQLLGGFTGLGTTGLIVGQLLGQWTGSLRVLRARFRVDTDQFRGLRARELWASALRYRKFPLFTAPAALLNAFDSNAPPLLFAYFFGSTVTGYFALGHRLLAIPFWLIASSAQKVFFPAAAKALHDGRLAEETQLTFRRLICLVLPMVTLLAACAPDTFSVLMGSQWREAGVYMQWLSLRTCFTLLVFPLMPLLYVLERQAVGTLFNGLQLVVRVSAILIGTHYQDPLLSIMLLGSCTGLMWLMFLGYLLVASGNSLLGAVQRFALEGAIAAALAAPVVLVKLGHASPLIVTGAAGFMGVVALLVIWRRVPGFMGRSG